MSFPALTGIALGALGALISVLFWTPLVNRRRLRELLGPRYRVMYFIYTANGPLLLLLGLILFFRFG